MEFPVVGAGEKVWPLRRSLLDELQSDYPHLDVLSSARSALAWVKANPPRRKTIRGMRRFLCGWLSRDQNQGLGRRSASVPQSDFDNRYVLPPKVEVPVQEKLGILASRCPPQLRSSVEALAGRGLDFGAAEEALMRLEREWLDAQAATLPDGEAGLMQEIALRVSRGGFPPTAVPMIVDRMRLSRLRELFIGFPLSLLTVEEE